MPIFKAMLPWIARTFSVSCRVKRTRFRPALHRPVFPWTWTEERETGRIFGEDVDTVNRIVMVNQITSLSYSLENGGKEGTADFEKAIRLCGYGKFHYGFLLLCGAMFLCAGCQNGINAYILPSAECDLHLTSEQKGLLNVSFLVGGVISSLFWGVFADAYGRRSILLFSLLCDSLLSIGGSFSQSFNVLLVFRGLNGFFIGAGGSLVYTYLGEFHAEKQRVRSICYVGFFWTLSWLILPGLAWIIIPLPISLQFYGMLYNSWRLFLAVIGIPTIIVTLVAYTYPESPKFLVSQGKLEEALAILRKIYARNTSRPEDEYPIKFLLPDETMSINSKKASSSMSDVIMELLKNIWQQMRCLASPPLLKYAFLCWTIYFANMFGYYGFGLWLPELFNRFETYQNLHPNRTVSVCRLIHEPDLQAVVPPSKNILIEPSSVTEDCSPHMDEMVFVNSLTINAVCLLGNIVSGYLANRVGRRTLPVTTMLLAGVFCFAIYFVRSSLQILMVTCVFSLMIVTANFVIGSVVVDIFPTHVGAVAICMMTCFGRIGAIASNLAFGMLLDISCEVPIFLVGSVVILGGLLAFVLPKKKG